MAYKFEIDEDFCTGCSACVVACKDKNGSPVGVNYRKVSCIESGSFPNVKVAWTSQACRHCDDPECVEACPVNACYKREEDGIVLIDEELCIGCKMCMEACPYDAISYNEETEKAEKCNACLDLIKEGKKPYCVQAANSRVLDFVEK